MHLKTVSNQSLVNLGSKTSAPIIVIFSSVYIAYHSIDIHFPFFQLDNHICTPRFRSHLSYIGSWALNKDLACKDLPQILKKKPNRSLSILFISPHKNSIGSSPRDWTLNHACYSLSHIDAMIVARPLQSMKNRILYTVHSFKQKIQYALENSF